MDNPEAVAALPQPPPVRRRGWAWHLILLLGYPIVLGLLSLGATEERSGAVLSPNTPQLLLTVAMEIGVFAVVFLLACKISGATAAQLYLPWRDGLWPLLRGPGYSIALRILVLIVVMVGVGIYTLFRQVTPENMEGLRPKVEVLIDKEAMANDPVYLILNLTLVSFVMAGLREELWRVGMIAAMQALWPRCFSSLGGGLIASAIVAVAFGLGHLPQGWGAVGLTTLLGFGLGAIIVFHRSIWDAVLAHGFFDATSFLGLYLLLKYMPDALGGG